MIFTEDDKAFVKIFVPYYRLWTTESCERIPWQKTKYVWIGQPITKLLKKGMSKAHAWSRISPVRIGLTSDAIGYSD